MTRRRRGRRPGDPRAGTEQPEQAGQPHVAPDGRPLDRTPRQPNAYTPPPSPLTRWQNHGAAQRGHAQQHHGRPRGSTGAYVPRNERRAGVPAPNRQREGRTGPNPNVERTPPSQGRPEQRSAPPTPSSGGKIDAFELFCAYHLGIAPDGSYRIQNIHEVARRFGTNAGDLRQVLADLGMAADDIVHSGFDLASAQVDIMVAPEGISRRELARPLYDEFRATPKKTRNWAREMEDAQRQIDETIGRDGRWSPTSRDPAGKQS
jgi:hypothetical protein